MRIFLLLTLITIFLLSACSKQGSSTTKLTIVSGNEKTGTSALSAGGAMLYGESKSLGINFAIPVTGELTKDLPNGDWTFYAVMWDGATPLAGTVKCAPPSSYTLKGQTVEVILTLSLDNCESAMFAKHTAFTNYDPNSLFYLNVVLCPPSTTQSVLNSNGYCSGYSGMATGFKVKVLQKDLGTSLTPSNITSACLPVYSYGNINSGLQLLSGTTPDYLGGMSFEVYYSPTYPSTCSGDDCCTGKVDTYTFPNGFGNQTGKSDEASFTSNSGNTLYLKEHSPAKKVTFTNFNSTAEYKACNAATLTLNDSSGNLINASEAVTVTPTCEGKCALFSDSGCTTGTSSYTIDSGTSSKNIYYIPTGGASLNFSHPGTASVAGDSAVVPVHTTWTNLDYSYVWAQANLYSIPNTVNVSPPSIFNGAVWIYETRGGYRGAMRINSVSTTTVTNDTFNFDFTTWNSGGGVIATGTNISITACFSGSCYLELDQGNFGVTSDTTTYQVEAWWENNSGLYFNPQSVQFLQLQP